VADPRVGILEHLDNIGHGTSFAHNAEGLDSTSPDERVVVLERLDERCDRGLADKLERPDCFLADVLARVGKGADQGDNGRGADLPRVSADPQADNPVFVPQAVDERLDEGLPEIPHRPNRVPAGVEVPARKGLEEGIIALPLGVEPGLLVLLAPDLKILRNFFTIAITNSCWFTVCIKSFKIAIGEQNTPGKTVRLPEWSARVLLL